MKVYVIRSGSKMYVGVSRDVNKRMKEHLKAESYIGRAMRKHGYSFKIVFEGSIQDCFKTEVRLIRELGTKWPQGYNLTDGGEGVVGETDEVRAARSKAMTIIMKDPERRARSAEIGRNQVWSDERKAAQAERARQQMQDPSRIEANRQSMSKRLKAMWSDPEYRRLKSNQAKAFWAARRTSNAG